jgi:hypothetical protein
MKYTTDKNNVMIEIGIIIDRGKFCVDNNHHPFDMIAGQSVKTKNFAKFNCDSFIVMVVL